MERQSLLLCLPMMPYCEPFVVSPPHCLAMLYKINLFFMILPLLAIFYIYLRIFGKNSAVLLPLTYM